MTRFGTKPLERQAEELANQHYERLQPLVLETVRVKLASRKMHVDSSDLKEAYCQAWHGVCEMIRRGTVISNLTGLLVEITWRRAVDGYRELRVEQRVEIQAAYCELDRQRPQSLDLRSTTRRRDQAEALLGASSHEAERARARGGQPVLAARLYPAGGRGADGPDPLADREADGRCDKEGRPRRVGYSGTRMR